MARCYTVTFNAVAITAAQDLFEITPADDKPVNLLGLFLGQTTDFGDAQDETLGLQIIRGHATGGSGGSAPTPGPMDGIDTAAGFTAEVNNTTVATTGSTVTLWSDAWNVRAGYGLWFPEGTQPRASQANTTIVVRMTAPTDSITANGTLVVAEA